MAPSLAVGVRLGELDRGRGRGRIHLRLIVVDDLDCPYRVHSRRPPSGRSSRGGP